MTSLTETLPILDEAVPALPGKVEAVARTAEQFHQAAQEALGLFRQKRAEADALVEQIRQVLDGVREQAAREEEHLESLAGALRQEVDEDTREVEEDADELYTAGQEAVAGFEALESELVEAGDRTETAHGDARGAIEALSEEGRTSGPELEGGIDAMVSAVGSAQQAIDEGQALVSQAVTSLKETMIQLLGDAQERLGQTCQHLDAVRAGQEKAVDEATTALEAQRGQLQQELQQRLEGEVREVLEPELGLAEAALGEMGQRVGTLQSEAQAAREELVEELTGVGGRIPPLQGGAQQVKQAAVKVGIDWP